MNKTKVCHLSSVHFALDTRIFYRFCLSLSDYYDVTLIAVHPKKETIHGVKILPFKRFKNKLLRVLITWLIMFFKAVKVRAKIYQIHDPELIPCALLLRLFGKKVILDLHENVAEDIFDKPWIRNKKILYWCFNVFEKIAIKFLFIFLAEKSYAKRYQRLGAKYEVVLNYFDPQFFHKFKMQHRSSMRIFYIGIILESRGLLEIAEAIHILNSRQVRVDFDVVGELYTDLETKLHALPFYSDIQGQIHFYGRLPLDLGYEISKKASVGMCIIHPMSNSVGSYPTKMFEYMAIGLPQVISNFPLYKSIVETHHSGICVNPREPLEIANAIESILTHPEMAFEMSKAGIEASTQYTWESEFQKALAVYRKL